MNVERTDPPASDERKWLGWEANSWARLVAFVVLVVGLLTVVGPALMQIDQIWEDPYAVPESVITEVTEHPDGTKTTKTTTAEADRSFVERSLAASGLLLLRIGIVALAAFLAGAVTQRTLLGNFALKLGPLEVPEIAKETEDALAAIGEQLQKQGDATENALRAAADAADAVTALSEELTELRENTLAFVAAFQSQPGDKADSSEEPTETEVDVELESDPDESEGT